MTEREAWIEEQVEQIERWYSVHLDRNNSFTHGSPHMLFVKLDRFIVNVDYILYVEDLDAEYVIYWDAGVGTRQSINVQKQSEGGANLRLALQERSK